MRLIASGEDRLVVGICCCTTGILPCCLAAFRSSDLQAQQQQQAQAERSQLQQPTQLAQIQQPGPQVPHQLAQPPQNGSAIAAADGGGDADPSRMLRIADSAAEHEAYYRAKLQEAQVTFVCYAVHALYTLLAWH